MMQIRKLEKSDESQLEKLIRDVENNLTDETFWLPITEKSRSHFFDEEWTYFLGAFCEDKLIGAVGLFLNENEYGESCEVLKISNKSIAEYGRAMVSPDYRNNGVMTKLSFDLLNYAKGLKIKNIIATVHPDNIASQSVVKKVGFEKKGFVLKYGKYARDIYLLEVSNEDR